MFRKYSAMSVSPRSVAVLAYDGLCTFEFALAVEVFGLRRPELDVPWYDFKVCAAEPGPLRAEGGVTMQRATACAPSRLPGRWWCRAGATASSRLLPR